ncbi:MAG: MATE family efflux transporter [Leadbetterella sp.]
MTSLKKYINLIWAAIKGHQDLDYTQIPIKKAIFFLAIPMMIEMFGESLFAIVEIFFVSSIDNHAVATVGLTESVMTIVYSIAWGISGGATALVSRRVGENNPEEAGKSAGQVVVLSLIIAFIIGISGMIFSESILRFMGASPKVIETGIPFTRMMFASSPVIILLYSLGGAIRGSGNASAAMKALWIANICNILLDILLIWILKWHVIAAAIASTIGRTLGVIMILRSLFKSTDTLTWKNQYLLPDKKILENLIKISFGATAQFIIASASWMFLARILASFGEDAVAGYTIAIRVIIFSILPSWGMANAAATLVGQNLGAKLPDRAESSVWITARINMVFLICIAIILGFFSIDILSLFNENKKVIEVGGQCIQIICLGYLAYGYGMILGQALNGAGDTLSPTIMNLICFWIIEIPLAYYLSRNLGLGPKGVFMGIAISESILAIVAIGIFRHGRWKNIPV